MCTFSLLANPRGKNDQSVVKLEKLNSIRDNLTRSFASRFLASLRSAIFSEILADN